MELNKFSVKVKNQSLDEVIRNGYEHFVDGKLVEVDIGEEEYNHEYELDPDEGEQNPRDLVEASVNKDLLEDEDLSWANCFYVSDVRRIGIHHGLTESNQYFHFKDTYYVTLRYGYYIQIEGKTEKNE
jgi:hypothetical protein